MSKSYIITTNADNQLSEYQKNRAFEMWHHGKRIEDDPNMLSVKIEEKEIWIIEDPQAITLLLPEDY